MLFVFFPQYKLNKICSINAKLFCMFLFIKLHTFNHIWAKLMIPEKDFSIKYFIGGYDKNITYLINSYNSKSQIIVDASVNINLLLPYIKDEPNAILITHTHKDHVNYIDQYTELFPRLTIIGHPDSNFISKKNKRVHHQQEIRIGDLKITALHTPGHYFDSICYILKPAIFTGDTLFVGRTGRVISKKSNINDLYDSIYNKILLLPKNTRIYPGHNYGKQITIQIKNNVKISPLLQAKNLDDFINIMNNYEINRKTKI